jgi:hypothetical protein
LEKLGRTEGLDLILRSINLLIQPQTPTAQAIKFVSLKAQPERHEQNDRNLIFFNQGTYKFEGSAAVIDRDYYFWPIAPLLSAEYRAKNLPCRTE